MSKEVWVEAWEQLAHRLKREPTEDEIIDYIASREEALYERVAEQNRCAVQASTLHPEDGVRL